MISKLKPISMATNINTAFAEFLKEKVNLDSEESKIARSSKDWLLTQLGNLDRNNDGFPSLASNFNLHYGSFARKTKIRELDDIDLMIGLSANGSVYNMTSATHAIITVNPNVSSLKDLCNPNTDTLNSIKVINCFISHLKSVHQYRKAELKRNQVAAVLNLTSYTWNYDIVPCFQTVDDADGNNFYFIPDGNGNWQKTDPRIDQAKVTDINQSNNGNVLNVVRIIKFWNKRRIVTTMPSYLIENLVLNYYSSTMAKASSYVDLEIAPVLEYISAAVFNPVPDPKGIQGDINSLSWDERGKVSNVAKSHANAARTARTYESNGDQHMCTLYWYDVFGDEFPRWG